MAPKTKPDIKDFKTREKLTGAICLNDKTPQEAIDWIKKIEDHWAKTHSNLKFERQRSFSCDPYTVLVGERPPTKEERKGELELRKYLEKIENERKNKNI